MTDRFPCRDGSIKFRRDEDHHQSRSFTHLSTEHAILRQSGLRSVDLSSLLVAAGVVRPEMRPCEFAVNRKSVPQTAPPATARRSYGDAGGHSPEWPEIPVPDSSAYAPLAGRRRRRGGSTPSAIRRAVTRKPA